MSPAGALSSRRFQKRFWARHFGGVAVTAGAVCLRVAIGMRCGALGGQTPPLVFKTRPTPKLRNNCASEPAVSLFPLGLGGVEVLVVLVWLCGAGSAAGAIATREPMEIRDTVRRF